MNLIELSANEYFQEFHGGLKLMNLLDFLDYVEKYLQIFLTKNQGTLVRLSKGFSE